MTLFHVAAADARVHVADADTAGQLALVEWTCPAAADSPRHRHPEADETYFVLEGTLRVWLAGVWREVPSGSAVVLPRGLEHAVVVPERGVRVLALASPAGTGGLQAELAARPSGAASVESLVLLAARHGCEITGPTPAVEAPSLTR